MKWTKCPMLICFKCGKLGHTGIVCKKKRPTDDLPKMYLKEKNDYEEKRRILQLRGKQVQALGRKLHMQQMQAGLEEQGTKENEEGLNEYLIPIDAEEAYEEQAQVVPVQNQGVPAPVPNPIPPIPVQFPGEAALIPAAQENPGAESDEEIKEEIIQSEPSQRGIREMRSLGIVRASDVPREVRNLNTEYNPTINEANYAQYVQSYSEASQYHVYSAITSDPGEPATLKEAMSGPESDKWILAVKSEINNFLSRKVWKKVPRLKAMVNGRTKLMTTKWVFKKKIEQDGSIRYKARCVSRGFMQIPGVDYTESFSPVSSDTAIRVTIGIFLYFYDEQPQEDWILEVFDVEAAFLNADIDRPQFIEWPEAMDILGYITVSDKLQYCIELMKAMYGNIDAPLCWMRTFTKFLRNVLLMEQCQTDPCLFYKKWNGKLVLIIVLYVDDALCAGTRKAMEWAFKTIELTYAIARLGRLKKHLGTWWQWKSDDTNKTYLVATMPKMTKEIA